MAPQIFGVVGGSDVPLIWSFAHSLPAQLALVVLVPRILALVSGWLAFRSRVTGVYLSILTQAMTLTVLHEVSVLADGSLDHVTKNPQVIEVCLGPWFKE